MLLNYYFSKIFSEGTISSEMPKISPVLAICPSNAYDLALVIKILN